MQDIICGEPFLHRCDKYKKSVDWMEEEQIKAIHSFMSSGSAACLIMFFPITLLFVQHSGSTGPC